MLLGNHWGGRGAMRPDPSPALLNALSKLLQEVRLKLIGVGTVEPDDGNRMAGRAWNRHTQNRSQAQPGRRRVPRLKPRGVGEGGGAQYPPLAPGLANQPLAARRGGIDHRLQARRFQYRADRLALRPGAALHGKHPGAIHA